MAERRTSDSEPEIEDDKYEALQEFVFETMASFGQKIKQVDDYAHKTREMLNSFKTDSNQSISFEEIKLSQLENRVETNTTKIKTMMDSVFKNNELEDEDINFEPIAESSPRKHAPSNSSPEIPRKSVKFRKVTLPPKESVRIPEFVNDVEEAELRSQLTLLEGKINYSKEKEKLTYCQLLFVYHWFEENGAKISGRSEQVLRLIRDGEDKKMWPKFYLPNNIKGDFFTYMQEKLKNMAKRKRINSHKEKFADILTMIEDQE